MSEYRCIGSFSKQVKRVNDANNSGADVYSVTKYDGFVRSLDYFKKQVFSRDLSAYKIVKKGEFAYSTIHLDEGALGLLADEEALISPMYTTFEVDGSVDRSYLSYLLKSTDLINQYGLIGQGSVNRRKSVPFSSLAEIEVYIPPLPEQKKIAEILSGIDRLTEAKKRRVKQRKLLLKSAFEDATKKEASDDFLPLSDLGRWRGGGTPSKSMPEYWGGEIPWVSPKDMKGRKISCSQDAITQEALENSTTSLIPKDSILFVVRSGILRHTFPIALATREVAINQDLKALTVSDYCNPNFLLHYLCCRSEEMLASCMKSGTTVESIDTNSLQNYLVPVISIQEQLRLSLFAESITTAIEAEESQVESLKMLKSSLGSDLLSGRKRVRI